MTDNTTAATFPSGCIIERTDTAPPTFFSAKIGHDFGNPAGGWTPNKLEATALTDSAADDLLATILKDSAPFCKKVAP